MTAKKRELSCRINELSRHRGRIHQTTAWQILTDQADDQEVGPRDHRGPARMSARGFARGPKGAKTKPWRSREPFPRFWPERCSRSRWPTATRCSLTFPEKCANVSSDWSSAMWCAWKCRPTTPAKRASCSGWVEHRRLLSGGLRLICRTDLSRRERSPGVPVGKVARSSCVNQLDSSWSFANNSRFCHRSFFADRSQSFA